MQVRLGLEEHDKSPWEWGNYLERNDGGDWTTLLYGGLSYEHAHESWLLDCDMATRMPDRYRNPRIVRRSVSPWEVMDHE